MQRMNRDSGAITDGSDGSDQDSKCENSDMFDAEYESSLFAVTMTKLLGK